MIKQKVLTLLVLLAAVVTGAWAQEQSETITTTATIVEGTHFTISNNDSYVDEYGMNADEGITVTSKNGETITKVVISCIFGPTIVNDGNTSVSSGTKEITNDGENCTVTVTGVNASTFTFTCSNDGPEFVQFVVYYTEASAAPAGYTVSMPQDTPDAEKWTVKAGQGQYQQLPLSGVEAGTVVTVKYSGTKRVKSVKAGKEAPTAPARTLAEATAEDLGKVVGADGKIYANVAAAKAASTTACAIIAYVGSETYDATFKNGLAIALADEGSKSWSTAESTCEGKTAITGAKWCLPSQDQWKQMFKANGGNEGSYTGLNNALAAAGGDSSKLQEYDGYWSSSVVDGDYVWIVIIDDGGRPLWDYGGKDGDNNQVRACLAF